MAQAARQASTPAQSNLSTGNRPTDSLIEEKWAELPKTDTQKLLEDDFETTGELKLVPKLTRDSTTFKYNFNLKPTFNFSSLTDSRFNTSDDLTIDSKLWGHNSRFKIKSKGIESIAEWGWQGAGKLFYNPFFTLNANRTLENRVFGAGVQVQHDSSKFSCAGSAYLTYSRDNGNNRSSLALRTSYRNKDLNLAAAFQFDLIERAFNLQRFRAGHRHKDLSYGLYLDGNHETKKSVDFITEYVRKLGVQAEYNYKGSRVALSVETPITKNFEQVKDAAQAQVAGSYKFGKNISAKARISTNLIADAFVEYKVNNNLTLNINEQLQYTRGEKGGMDYNWGLKLKINA